MKNQYEIDYQQGYDNANDEWLERLDKIRAEITNIPITDSDGHYNNWYREPQAIINDVLRIIDKNKASTRQKVRTRDEKRAHRHRRGCNESD